MTVSSSNRRIAVNTASRAAALVVNSAISFFLTPYLISTIGVVHYGLQSLSSQALKFVDLLSGAISLSFNRFATLYHAQGKHEEMNAAAAAGLTMSLVSAGLFALGTLVVTVFAKPLFGLSPDLVPVARAVLLITGFATVFHIVAGVWLAPIYITQRLYIHEIRNVLVTVGSSVAVVIAFRFLQPSIVIWALLLNGFGVGVVLLVIPVARRCLPAFRLRLAPLRGNPHLKDVAHFSGASLLGTLGFLLYSATDSMIISNVRELGTDQITYYNIGQRWDPMIRTLIAAFAGALSPQLTALVGVGDLLRVRGLILRSVRLAVIIGLYPTLALALYAEPFIRAWVGDAFVPSGVPVMRWIMAGVMLGAPAIVCGEVLYAVGKIGVWVTALFVTGVLSILLSLFFVKWGGLGLTGVAVGMVLAMSVKDVVVIPALTVRYTGVGLWPLIGSGFLKGAAGAVPMVATALLLQRLWPPAGLPQVFTHFAICGVVYLAVAWWAALTHDDRASLRASVMGWLERRSETPT